MAVQTEKIYYLENPETGVKKVVTESQLKFGDTIKEVFGVASVSDLTMMIQYNKKLQSCICNAHHIQENEITLDRIFRLASEEDLLQMKNS